MRRKRGDSPMHHQIAAVRAELHDYVDRWCDDWPAIDQWAAMAIRRAVDTQRRSNEHSDPTASAAMVLSEDPWSLWLERFRAFRVEARLVEAARERLRPVSEQERTRLEEAAQEPCARCGMVNPSMKRIDGRPYCKTAFVGHGIHGQACYYLIWRERRATVQPADNRR